MPDMGIAGEGPVDLEEGDLPGGSETEVIDLVHTNRLLRLTVDKRAYADALKSELFTCCL